MSKTRIGGFEKSFEFSTAFALLPSGRIEGRTFQMKIGNEIRQLAFRANLMNLVDIHIINFTIQR